MKAETQHYFV